MNIVELTKSIGTEYNLDLSDKDAEDIIWNFTSYPFLPKDLTTDNPNVGVLDILQFSRDPTQARIEIAEGTLESRILEYFSTALKAYFSTAYTEYIKSTDLPGI